MFGPRRVRDAKREEAMERLRTQVGRGEMPESAIKALREDLGMSQRGLARETGVSQTVISRIESGDAPLTRQVAGKLAVALKADRHDLAVAESLSHMGRLAVEGKLSQEMAAGVAVHLIENEPDSEAGRRLTEAALEELVRMTEAAAVAEDKEVFVRLQMRRAALPVLIREAKAAPIRREIDRLEAELAGLEFESRRAQEVPQRCQLDVGQT